MLLAAGSGLSLAASRFACRFSALEDELASARKERDQAAEEAAVLRQDKQDCERALAQHKEATRALSHNLQGKLADLEAQVAARAQENAELQKKVDNSALEVTAVLEQRATSNHELRIEHQKLQHNFRAKSEECTKLAKRLATQEQLVAAVEAELRSAQEAWSEVKELAQKQSKDMSDHQQRVHAIIVSEEALIDKIAQQRRQARQQEAKLRECKAELAISMVQVADLTATLKIRDSQISGLQAANAEHVQQHSESAARLKQLLADLQTSHQMVETLRKTVRDQHAAMEALRVSNQALYEKINQAQPADPHELHKLAQVQHLTTRCSLLEEQTEAAKHHRDEAQQPGAVAAPPGQQPGAPPAQVSAVEAALGKRAVEAAPLSGSQHRSQLFGFAAATQPASATERAGGSAGRGLHDIFSTIPFGVALSDSDDDSPPQHQVTGPTGTKSVNQNGDQAQTPQRLPSTAVATPASSGCPCGEREFGLMLSCASCSARVHAHCVTAHAADAKSWICESCALLPAAQAAPPSVNPAGNGASKRKRQAGARGKAGKAPAAKRQAR
ncbi:hypothetical protein WJX72_009981 [[Myrmecia] bisecta]|uniref:Zinc finger PHD-type domain-containing protein n=1 Tax=[Myrmecia] bisecta TaxID=41462 RepID=A0AAW1PA06_9CHLO